MIPPELAIATAPRRRVLKTLAATSQRDSNSLGAGVLAPTSSARSHRAFVPEETSCCLPPSTAPLPPPTAPPATRMSSHATPAPAAAKSLAYPPPLSENETTHSAVPAAPFAPAHRSNPLPPSQTRQPESANPWRAAPAQYFDNAPKAIFPAQFPPHPPSADRSCPARPPARTLLPAPFVKPKPKAASSSAPNKPPRKSPSAPRAAIPQPKHPSPQCRWEQDQKHCGRDR